MGLKGEFVMKIGKIVLSLIVLALGVGFHGAALAARSYEDIKESGILRVGTEGTYKPFTYHDEQDKLVGYDVEVAAAVAEKMGLKVEFSEITWEGLLMSLDNGTIDAVFNQVGLTAERLMKYDFSVPYLYSYIALIIQKENKAISSWESARGSRTSLNVSSNYALIAEKYGMKITASDTFHKDIGLLLDGRVDVVINNTIAFNDYIQTKPDVPIHIVDVLPEADTVAVPLCKGNTELLNAMNGAFKEIQEDGTLSRISEKYLGEDFSHELSLDEVRK